MTEVQLLNCQRALAKVSELLTKRHGFKLDPFAIQTALVATLDLVGPEWLPERELTAEAMLALLEGYAFCQVIDAIQTDLELLPSGIPGRLDEERRKLNGAHWEIHLSDADDWPSKPHAHNVETGLKLDLRTGDLYDPRRKRKDAFVSRMRRSNLVRLRGLFTVDLPALAENP